MELRTVFRELPSAAPVTFCGQADAEGPLRFHRGMPGYAPTELVSLPALAQKLGVASIHVKDESSRLGLNAFKVLGSSYAMAQIAGQRLGLPPEDITFERLTSPEAAEKLRGLTFVTATDGNHGRGVAWTAARLGCRSVVLMPKGTAQERLDNIRRLGSDASITDMPYDDCVRTAARLADEHGWILTQDTSWPGYESIPRLIMQGYTTMAHEALEQLHGVRPTHVFLQCGVGSMAGAVAAYLCDCAPQERPRIIVVEPLDADCMLQTALHGSLHATEGRLRSMMAGLCCGEPCSEAWELLSRYASDYIAMPDEPAALGMRTLAHPFGHDPRIISGESGASGIGLAIALLSCPELRGTTARLGLGPDARILCFSTEGCTDHVNWHRVVEED